MVEHVFETLRDACASLDISLVGGHTEITTGLDRVILTGMMVGDAREEDLIDPRNAKPGDALLLARGIAIEGTSLIAREMSSRLAESLDAELIERAHNFLHEPGISVVRAATILRASLGRDLHALHDPTEGGLATGIREIAIAAGTGVVVEREQITVYPETRAICDLLHLDPLGLIASGALLAAVEASRVAEALAALERDGIPATRIGTLVEDPSVSSTCAKTAVSANSPSSQSTRSRASSPDSISKRKSGPRHDSRPRAHSPVVTSWAYSATRCRPDAVTSRS